MGPARTAEVTPRTRARCAVTSAGLAIALAMPTVALAQPVPFRRPPPPPTLPTPVPPTATLAPQASSLAAPPPLPGLEPTKDLRAHFGVEVATRLLRSGDPDERLRGIQRAAAAATPEAMSILVQAAEPSGPARGDSRAMLEVARGLAPFADQGAARNALLALVTASPPAMSIRSLGRGAVDPTAEEADGAARASFARHTAAMALAASGDPRAVDALIGIARTGTLGQPAAVAALAAYPPVTGAGLTSSTLMTPSTIRLVAELGDLRGLEAIRVAAKASDLPTRASAIVALGAMGDGRGIEIARAGLADRDPRGRAAAAEALVLLDAPERFAAVEALVADDTTAAAGIVLARRVHNDKIVRAVAARATAAGDPEVRANAVLALGRAPTLAALRALYTLLKEPTLGGDAADAIARSPGVDAMAAIEKMVTDPALRRLAVRAYVVRALVRREHSDALDAVCEQMAAGNDPREHPLGVFARVALGKRGIDEALLDKDPRARRAAAMGAMADPATRSRASLLRHLGGERDPATRQVLAFGLAAGDPGGEVTTLMLTDRAQAGEPDAPLAALALARRLEAGDDRAMTALLSSRDRLVRMHAARGLAESSVPDASGRLAAQYAYEPEPLVRRAVIAALAARRGSDATAPARTRTLEIAARLDSDRHVRFLATRAIAGAVELAPTEPAEVAWIRLATIDGSAPPADMVGALLRSDGLAVPIAFDLDGYAIVPGVPPGEGRLVLAPRVPAYQGSVQ
jgi:HEAT repeat protein